MLSRLSRAAAAALISPLLFAGVYLFTLPALAVDEGVYHTTPPEQQPKERVDFETILLCDWLYQDLGLKTNHIFTSGTKRDAEKALVLSVCDGIEKEAAERGEEVSAADLRSEADALAADKVPGNDPRWKDLYKRACALRRAGRLAIVEELSPEFLYTKHFPMGSGHYAYTEDVSDAQFIEHYDRCLRVPGGALCRGHLGQDARVISETIVDTPTGVVRDPDVSYDGKRVVFSMRKSFDRDDYHLYDWDSATGEIRQLTKGLGFADYEPVYLPDDSLIFLSTRCMQMIDCWWTDAANLYACDGDGRYTRRIGFDQVTVNYPKMTADGRVIYTRWDYNDRGHIFPQGLFVMNPDGTAQTAYYGNNSWFPTAVLQARDIPDTGGKILAVVGGHHCIQKGKLAILDRTKGTEETVGVELISPRRELPSEVHIDEYGQDGDQFMYPYPFDENNFLISYRPDKGDRGEGLETQFGLYWMNPDGARELLVWDYDLSCGQPIPLAERSKPIIRPSQVDYKVDTGRFYVQNVYEGPGLEGVEKGTIKSLRVIALEFRAAQVYEGWNFGEGGGTTPPTPIGCDNCTWDIKHIIGDVPVEEDGSAFFEVPARTPVYFQLLDENGEMVQTMRSWSTLMPNEFFGCVGCHEPKSATMDNLTSLTTNNQTLALQKGVTRPVPVDDPVPGQAKDWGFSFIRDVQPILERYCTDCHTGDRDGEHPDDMVLANRDTALPIGGESKPFSLLANGVNNPPSTRRWCYSEDCGRLMAESYVNLTESGRFEKYLYPIQVQDGPQMIPPYRYGATQSKMMQILRDPDEDHRGLNISDHDLRILAAWIDLVVPYCGNYDQEAALWSDRASADYAYNLMKRTHIDGIESRNIQKMLAAAAGGAVEPFDQIEQPSDFSREMKAAFIENYPRLKRDVRNRRTGSQNVYRDLAANADDVQGDARVRIRPHAQSNSEYRYASAYAARNVIAGGGIWMPNYRTDAWLSIDLGHEAEIDKVVISLSDAKPTEGFFTSGVLEFSDGSTLDVVFEPKAGPQEFTFPKKRVTSVKLTKLAQPMPMRYRGIAKVEIWGTSAASGGGQ